MKFLLVSPFTNASGSSIRFWNIALELKKQGHSVVLVERKAGKNKKPIFFSSEIKYYASPSTGNLIGDILVSLIFNFAILLRHIDCTVFYALKPAPNNCIPALFARLIHKRTLLDIDDLDYAYWKPSFKRSFSKLYFDFFAKRFPIVTYHTPNLKTYLHSTLLIEEKKLYYLAQGVSDDFLKVNTTTAKEKKSIIYVATLGITSDFEALIPMLARICSIHTDTAISIVGDGVRRCEFEQKVRKLGIAKNVTFTGAIDHKKLPNFISKHQIGINYMHKSEANDCRAILKIREYLACGLQIVCNTTGDTELFKDFIHAEDNLELMENKILSLLLYPTLSNTNGREAVENEYQWNVIIKKFIFYLKQNGYL